MQLWTAFLLGLFGSLHCAGMCGPLALALPGGNGGFAGFAAGRVVYNCGRMATYSILGLLFGVLGRGFVIAGVQRWVSIALGISLLLGLALSRRLALAAPVVALVSRLKMAMAAVLRRRSLQSLGLMGLLNGLLPCGLVYVACAGAATTGKGVSGAAYMAVFGLGTVPMMLALSLSGRLIPAATRLKLVRLVPVSVAVLGVLLILRGMSLGIPYISPDLSGGPGAAVCCPVP